MATDTERKWTPEEWRREFVLHWGWRSLIALAGALLLLLSALLYFAPPERTVSEYYPNARAGDKVTTTTAESPSLVIASFGVGLAFLTWAINGLRVRNFEGLGVKVDVPAVEQPGPLANTTPAIAGNVVVTPAPAPAAAPVPDPTLAALPGQRLADVVVPAPTPESYFAGQVGIDRTHTFMLRSSWHALKVLKACQYSKDNNVTFSLREVSSRTGMGYDYAVGYFVASYSADVIEGAVDPASGMARVMNTKPTLAAKIDEVIAGNLAVAPALEAKKVQELAALRDYLVTLRK